MSFLNFMLIWLLVEEKCNIDFLNSNDFVRLFKVLKREFDLRLWVVNLNEYIFLPFY